MYQYQAVIQKIIDGDTFEIDIDLGLSIWVHNERIRLFGVDTPEVYGVKMGSPEWVLGNKASEFVKSVLHQNDEIIVETVKDKKEKYGRYLAVVYAKIDAGILSGLTGIRALNEFSCVNDVLVAKGLARVYMI